MTLTPATLRNDLKCGAGAISPGEKCHKGQATKAARFRNYGKEIKAHQGEMEETGLVQWMKRNNIKAPKAGDEVGWDKLHRQWRQTPEAVKHGEAAKKLTEAKRSRRVRNGRIAFGVGVAAGLAAFAASKPRRDAAGRACGASFIAAGKQCHQKGARPNRKAIAAGLAAGAVGAALLHKGSRQAIFGAPGAMRRTAQQAVTEVVHRATAKPASMTLNPKAFEGLRPLSKTQRLHLAAKAANQEAERAIGKAAKSEIERATAVGTAMYKAGQATRASLRSGMRTHNLTVEKLRRRMEPGYRKPRRDNYVQHYAPVLIDPARQLPGKSPAQ